MKSFYSVLTEKIGYYSQSKCALTAHLRPDTVNFEAFAPRRRRTGMRKCRYYEQRKL